MQDGILPWLESNRDGRRHQPEQGDAQHEHGRTTPILSQRLEPVVLLEARVQRVHHQRQAEAQRGGETEQKLLVLREKRRRGRRGPGEGELEADAHERDRESLDRKEELIDRGRDDVASHGVVLRPGGRGAA
eukprot:2086959-Prymnesium_polylepis.1